jgi:hypothetical protein
MELPDKFLLKKVRAQGVYCDRQSKEVATKIIKPKYKVAGNQLLNIFTFFVATKNKGACQRGFTIEVQRKHWEQLQQGHLSSPFGYIDITKLESFTDQEIISKMKDRRNGFPCVARLCDEKYQELRQLRQNPRLGSALRTTEKMALATMALDDVVDMTKFHKDLLVKLGLG